MALGAKANWSSAARGLQDLGSGLNSKLSPRRFGDSEASFQMGDGTAVISVCNAQHVTDSELPPDSSSSSLSWFVSRGEFSNQHIKQSSEHKPVLNSEEAGGIFFMWTDDSTVA